MSTNSAWAVTLLALRNTLFALMLALAEAVPKVDARCGKGRWEKSSSGKRNCAARR